MSTDRAKRREAMAMAAAPTVSNAVILERKLMVMTILIRALRVSA